METRWNIGIINLLTCSLMTEKSSARQARFDSNSVSPDYSSINESFGMGKRNNGFRNSDSSVLNILYLKMLAYWRAFNKVFI